MRHVKAVTSVSSPQSAAPKSSPMVKARDARTAPKALAGTASGGKEPAPMPVSHAVPATPVSAPAGKGEETRAQLKQVALALFAERGVDGVSVRDILAAAGQRSGGALHYHFGGKEGLLRELIADAAAGFDGARLLKLDALAAKGGAPTLRDVLRILADPFEGAAREAHVPRGFGALLNALQVEHYQAFTEGVEGLDVGYRQCVAMLRELLPELTRTQLNQRIRLMMLFLFSASSARERAGESSVWQQFWAEPSSRETLLDCLEGMLRQPSA